MVAIIVATALVLALDAIDDLILSRYLATTPAIIIEALLALVGIGAFTWGMFAVLGAVQRQLSRQNDELRALHTAGLAVNLDLKLDVVLQRVVDEAARLTGARYAAVQTIASPDHAGTFVTTGIDPETRRSIGHPPKGRGVLGLALDTNQAFRLEDISTHPASVGFPPGHPPMRTLLTAPISSGEEIYGQLYLAEKHSGEDFDRADQETVERFAALAALALKNAHQLQRIEALAIVAERNRVAREMHDGVAQIFGYVSTKSQAASELVQTGQPDRAIEYLAEIQGVAGEALDDVRHQIVALRMDVADECLPEAIRRYLAYWSRRSGIRSELSADDGIPTLAPETRLQILRIVQEALTNIEKHAQATQATVRIQAAATGILIDVDDDGLGISDIRNGMREGPRFGVAIMTERARAISGQLDLLPSERGGVRVRLRLPLPAEIAKVDAP